MNKWLLMMFVVAITASRGLWSCPVDIDTINVAVKQVETLMSSVHSHYDYGRYLQVLMGLRYSLLVGLGAVNLSEAVRFGKCVIDCFMRELVKFETYGDVAYEGGSPRVSAQELRKDFRPFVQRLVEFLVQAGQRGCAQKLAINFEQGAYLVVGGDV